MSLVALAWAKKQRTGSPSAKAVLQSIADYADEHGRAYPSQSTVADDTELSTRTVRDQLGYLEKHRFLRREQRVREDGSRSSDLIVLLFDRVATAAPPPATDAGGTEGASGGVGRELPGGGETVSPLTTFEPSTEPRKSPSQGVAASAALVVGTVAGDHERSLTDRPSPTGKPTRRVAEHPIPDGYPDAEAVQHGRERFRGEGVDLDASAQAERFRNYSLQHDRRCRDWSAAWRNWLSKAAELWAKDHPEAAKRASAQQATVTPEARTFRLRHFEDTGEWREAWGPRPWLGPADLRAAAAALKGDPWCLSYLDLCGWRGDPDRVLVPYNGFMGRVIRNEIGHLLARFNVTVQEPVPCPQ